MQVNVETNTDVVLSEQITDIFFRSGQFGGVTKYLTRSEQAVAFWGLFSQT